MKIVHCVLEVFNLQQKIKVRFNVQNSRVNGTYALVVLIMILDDIVQLVDEQSVLTG